MLLNPFERDSYPADHLEYDPLGPIQWMKELEDAIARDAHRCAPRVEQRPPS